LVNEPVANPTCSLVGFPIGLVSSSSSIQTILQQDLIDGSSIDKFSVQSLDNACANILHRFQSILACFDYDSIPISVGESNRYLALTFISHDNTTSAMIKRIPLEYHTVSFCLFISKLLICRTSLPPFANGPHNGITNKPAFGSRQKKTKTKE